MGTTSSYNLITTLPTSFPLIDILKKTLLFFSIYVIVHTPRVNKVRYRISVLSRGDRKKDGMRWGGSLRKGFIIFVDWIVVFLVLFVVFLDFGHDVLIVHDCRNSRRFGKKIALYTIPFDYMVKRRRLRGEGRKPFDLDSALLYPLLSYPEYATILLSFHINDFQTSNHRVR